MCPFTQTIIARFTLCVKAVRPKALAIPIPRNGAPSRRALVELDQKSSIHMAHTSLFRWVTAAGGSALRQPTTLHGDLVPAPRKYTSERRREVLIACRTTCSALLSGRASVVPHRN